MRGDRYHANRRRRQRKRERRVKERDMTNNVGRFKTAAAIAAVVAAAALPPAARAATVSGGQAEAKAAAKAVNCTPTKVEVMKYVPGRMEQTVFKIGCSEDKDAFVLVACRARNCAVMF